MQPQMLHLYQLISPLVTIVVAIRTILATAVAAEASCEQIFSGQRSVFIEDIFFAHTGSNPFL
jgi:hypothetical protein